MLLKEYQQEALQRVRQYFDALAETRALAVTLQTEHSIDFDWPAEAWKKLSGLGTYFPRRNGLGKHLPSFCLKIPTGGGKTLLATKVIDLANTTLRNSNRGLVLWVVPTTQIYNQTLLALKDRSNPYRQTLDNASGGRTLILERTQRFSPADIADNLCILLLMLPAAARQTNETLRMFRDSGGFDAFFPTEEDYEGHKALLNKVPNLDTFDQTEFSARQVKTSLGNTLRLLQPLIILDEGQKAYSELARKTIEGFNPSMVVELSATPPHGANALVDIKGAALEREGMIKLDLHLFNESSTDWKKTLLRAAEHRDKLEAQAREHEARTGKYIRPICLIQVERTGREQRDSKHIHSEDVREYLLQRPGITSDQVAVKTSEKDELKEVDDIGGLLSRDCSIRYIITKQALQEGWDCSFAYVLAVLTNPSSKTALTQLVGRILRQPYAKKTGNSWLDESYVFCFQRRGNDLLKEIRAGFGQEGFGDLQGRIIDDSGRADYGGDLEIFPRARFKKPAEHLVLPAFMIKDGKHWRPVHYQSDILSRVPWGEVDITPLLELQLPDGQNTGRHTRHNLDEKILDDLQTELQGERLQAEDNEEPDCAFAASHLLDVMPNPWRGNEIARHVFATLLKKNERRKVLDNYVFVLDEMHRQLLKERDRLARKVFYDLLEKDVLRFMVVTDDLDFNKLPSSVAIQEKEPRANNQIGKPYQKSLFEDMPAADFNGFEQAVATFLDAQEPLFFWFRNRSRSDYYIQAWQPHKIYADFVYTTFCQQSNGEDEIDRVFVVETKGQHLAGVVDAKGNLTDTGYKREVLDLCTKKAQEKNWNELVPFMKNKRMRFEVVDQDGWETRLTELVQVTA